jgi:hypothetical protein
MTADPQCVRPGLLLPPTPLARIGCRAARLSPRHFLCALACEFRTSRLTARLASLGSVLRRSPLPMPRSVAAERWPINSAPSTTITETPLDPRPGRGGPIAVIHLDARVANFPSARIAGLCPGGEGVGVIVQNTQPRCWINWSTLIHGIPSARHTSGILNRVG